MRHEKINLAYVQRLKEKRAPVLADFELTDRCNLNCLHCCVRSDDVHSKRTELTTKQVCSIIGQMRDEGVMYLTLSGGEPLLRHDFDDIYLFAKKKNFAITVVTNGTLITRDRVRMFKRSPPLALEITRYGVSDAVYDAFTRTPGAGKLFKKAMRLLAGSGIRMSVRTMVMKSNYRDVMRNATADMNCVIGLPLTLRRDRDASKNAAIIKERLTADEIDRFSREFHRNYVSARRNGGMLYRHLDACHCSTLNRMLLCDGNITWCHMMPSPFNLKTMTYCEASRRLYSEGSLFRQQDKACGSCAHRAYCKWCPGKAFLETGSTTKKIPYLCGVMKGLHKRGG